MGLLPIAIKARERSSILLSGGGLDNYLGNSLGRTELAQLLGILLETGDALGVVDEGDGLVDETGRSLGIGTEDGSIGIREDTSIGCLMVLGGRGQRNEDGSFAQ